MAMNDSNKPLVDLEEWEDFLKERYPEPQADAKAFQMIDPEKKKDAMKWLAENKKTILSQQMELGYDHE